ncbi:hypothetical protein B0T21DRAFT_300742 [Apiosordaria backusii]|uniref:Rhodopsin domain-containing protein n=1 Tax=Apiosordaria backusii TaxID=314023 RepID=A0AA39ZPD1_9PEZI|nr:hypothetical protein B0T21DRAFT_300742 [Apiosordaria backusii]
MDTSTLTPEMMELLLDFPMAFPPPGETANLDNPPSDSYQVFVLTGFCAALMLTFSMARLLATTWLGQRAIRIHEIVFYTGLVTSLGVLVTSICGRSPPYGIRSWNVRLGDFKKIHLVSAHLVQVITPIAQFFVKASVLLLYLNLFGILRWMRIASMIGIGSLLVFQFSVAIALTVACSPTTGQDRLDYIFAFSQPQCQAGRRFWIVMSIGSVVSDICLIILPLPAVWSLRLPFKRKLGVMAMFSIGFCGLISSILTLYYRAFWYSKALSETYGIPLWSTTIAEVTVGVMISCMPALAVIWRKVRSPVSSEVSSVPGGTGGKSFGRSFGRSFGTSFIDHQTRLPDGNDRVYCHAGTADRHTVWVNTGTDSVSMQELNWTAPGGIVVGKQTEVQVSRLV